MKVVHWKLIIILAIIAVALGLAFPRAGRPIMNMSLGLDLKGGSHLLMRVVTGDAVKAEMDLLAEEVGTRLRREGFPQVTARVSDASIAAVDVGGIPEERLPDARTVLEEDFSVWKLSETGGVLRLTMLDSEERAVRDRAVRQALNTISNRIDEFGVAEPVIQRIGGSESDRILVQLPGVEDPARVKSILQTQARLELRLLYYTPEGGGPFQALDRDGVIQALGGSEPPGVEALPWIQRDKETGEKSTLQWVAVEKTAAVTGGDLQDARRSQGDLGDNVVAFTLRVAAANRFARFTRENIGNQMAIVLDDEVVTAPSIRNEISTRGQIEGAYGYDEAEDLALVLRAGALPARVNTIEERTVGPSLGRDSIVSGVRAAALGFLFVMAFMVVYYKLSGINAVVALLLNLLLVAAAMAAMGATLTLPGIGGFILTVGMAVDANVLIFERIREELGTGKTVRGALDAGFSKALSAILDANVTTLIAALFLFQYGTGPVRGFAVTLSIGILASMFTAIFVSRTLYDLALGERAVSRLSI
ncbi:MAG: protein translocase subunit SecD [Acidobacteriota bacterium]|nr:protein translocase subunit SecD [Acidobacteriota bacterium]